MLQTPGFGLVRDLPRVDVEVAPVASTLRDRVLREIDPSAAANMTTDVLARNIEMIIHQIANDERLPKWPAANRSDWPMSSPTT